MIDTIVKRPGEIMPLTFNFVTRLGSLARGATITSVEDLTVTPTGDVDDLDIGTPVQAKVNEVTNLQVQCIASKGRAGTVYHARCSVIATHAGNPYTFEVILPIVVRG